MQPRRPIGLAHKDCAAFGVCARPRNLYGLCQLLSSKTWSYAQPIAVGMIAVGSVAESRLEGPLMLLEPKQHIGRKLYGCCHS